MGVASTVFQMVMAPVIEAENMRAVSLSAGSNARQSCVSTFSRAPSKVPVRVAIVFPASDQNLTWFTPHDTTWFALNGDSMASKTFSWWSSKGTLEGSRSKGELLCMCVRACVHACVRSCACVCV